jgi:hypothetical protein
MDSLSSSFRRAARVAAPACGVAAILGSSLISSSPALAAKQPTPVSSPTITMMLEPYMPDGGMRLYPMATGVSYWTGDLPIYNGDKVKLDVFVATGADTLQELKVRLDNNQVADISKGPWTTTLDTDTLGNGYHYVEAWAYVSGPKPQYISRTLTFFVSKASDATVIVPQTKVLPSATILQNGVQTPVPLPAGEDNTTPVLPMSLTSAGRDMKATVKLVLRDARTQGVISGENTPHIYDAALVDIVPTAGSTAQRFAYSLVSSGQTILTQDELLSIATTDVRLQVKTATDPGLLPGTATVWVWGVDSQGKYGPASSVTVQMEEPSGA